MVQEWQGSLKETLKRGWEMSINTVSTTFLFYIFVLLDTIRLQVHTDPDTYSLPKSTAVPKRDLQRTKPLSVGRKKILKNVWQPSLRWQIW